MVRENVDIVFRDQGIAVIKRKIDDLGEASARATRGVFLLQRAIFTLGGFGIVRALSAQADALTNLENRLKLTTETSRELQSVQTELFDIARRSRASLDGVAQTYTRTALSAKALGRSQAEVLDFTETVTKAAVLSGASTQEINASLIQLGQGIASNRLGGDELRSILEQLPLVADIIAKSIGVTRGELRELGSEGKLTGDVILKAFKEAKTEIDALFAQTAPTIGQAFAVARTNFLEFLDAFDDATGASAKVATAIITISENIEILVKAAAAFAAIFGVSLFGRLVKSITSYGRSLREANVQQTALRSRLVDIRAATLSNVEAIGRTAAIRQREATQNLALIAQKKIMIQQELQEAQVALAVRNQRTLSVAQTAALAATKANLAAITQRLNIVENQEALQTQKLTAARGLQAVATQAAIVATQRLTAAQAAATLSGRALGAALTGLRAAGSGLLAFFGGIPGLILLAVGALAAFILSAESAKEKFDRISENTFDATASIESLKAVQERLNEAIRDSGVASNEATATIIANSQAELLAKAKLLQFERDDLIKLQTERKQAVQDYLGQITAIQEQIKGIEGSLDRVKNADFQGYQDLLKTIDTLNGEIEVLRRQIAEVEGASFDTERQIAAIGETLRSAYSDVLVKAGGIVDRATAFAAKTLEAAANGSTFAGLNLAGAIDPANTAADSLIAKLVAGINLIRQAIGLAATGSAALDVPPNPGQINTSPRPKPNGLGIDGDLPPEVKGSGGGGGGGGSQVSFADELANITKKIELEKQYGIQKEINNNILSTEDKLKRSLSATEKEQISNATKLLDIAKIQGEILQEINGPQDTLIATQTALNNLFAEGAITLAQYNAKLFEARAAADAASGTFGGTFRAAILGASENVADLGKSLGEGIVNFAGQASNALVDFALTGKGSIKELFAELFANLARIIANNLFMEILGGLGGGFLGGGGGGGLGSLLGFADGGSILPTGPGSTDSQVVAFKKRPDERVDILTPGQQEAQKKNGSGNSSNSPMVSPNNVKILNVLDPSIVGDFLSTGDGENVIMNVLRKNGVV
jgi:tape measure domain-containing protein